MRCITFLFASVLLIIMTGCTEDNDWVADDQCTSTEIPFSDLMAGISGTEGSQEQQAIVQSLLELIQEDNALAWYEEDCLRELERLDGTTILGYFYMSKRYAEISTITPESRVLIQQFLASQ